MPLELMVPVRPNRAMLIPDMRFTWKSDENNESRFPNTVGMMPLAVASADSTNRVRVRI